MNNRLTAERIRRDRDTVLTIFAVLAGTACAESGSAARAACSALLRINPESTEPSEVVGIFHQVGEASTAFDPDGDWDFAIDLLVDAFEKEVL